MAKSIDEKDLDFVFGGINEVPENPRDVYCPKCGAKVHVDDIIPGCKWRKCPNFCPDFFA